MKNWLVIIALLLTQVGCASLGGKDPLNVTLAGLEPLPGQGLELRMAVKLRVQNPNDAAINFDGVAVNLDLRGSEIATGVSDAKGSVPRFGETVITVPVTVSSIGMLKQIYSVAKGERGPLDFVARGKLAGTGFGTTRFESKGSFDLPSLLPGVVGGTAL
jgi:hypothetical protein